MENTFALWRLRIGRSRKKKKRKNQIDVYPELCCQTQETFREKLRVLLFLDKAACFGKYFSQKSSCHGNQEYKNLVHLILTFPYLVNPEFTLSGRPTNEFKQRASRVLSEMPDTDACQHGVCRVSVNNSVVPYKTQRE